MKRFDFISTIFFFFFFSNCFSQQNDEVYKKSLEIVQWINAFENSNSVERIMQGTMKDKVHVEYSDGILTIYSMLWQGSKEPILHVREIFTIKDIIRIEAKEKNVDNFIIADIAIFVKENSISLECKKDYESEFYKFNFEKKWFEKVGFCSLNLRFKFSKESAATEIKRVFNALADLCFLHGGNPKIGSLY